MAEIDFLAIFRSQVEGQLRSASDLALELERASGAGEDITTLLESLMREFHTIKGAARAIQFDEIKDVAHQIEDIYHALMDGEGEVRMPDLTNLTLHALDLVEGHLQSRVDGTPFSGNDNLRQAVQGYLKGEPLELPTAPAEGAAAVEAVEEESAVAEVSTETEPEPEPVEVAVTDAEAVVESGEAERSAPEAENSAPGEPPITAQGNGVPQAGATRTQSSQSAGDYEQLTDSLLTVSGEFTVAIDALQDQRQMMRGASQRLTIMNREMGLFIGLMMEKIQQAGIEPPLERMSDLQRKMRIIGNDYSASIESLDLAESRLQFLGENLRDEVTRARLVPLSNLFSNYPRVVRDLAQELGKQCRIEITGEQTRIDRAVLEAVRAPMIHLLRNGLDHGLETPEVRRAAGKPDQGKLTLKAVQLGGQIRITLEDDGRGINMDHIGEKVVQRGDTTQELWQAMTDQEREQFLFLPGFSTAKQVSATSGRGFGLDIVKVEVEKVGGMVTLEVPESGHGTRFVVELPLTLSLTRCLMVSGGKSNYFGRQTYAFPLNEIGEVRRANSADLRQVEGRESILIDKDILPLHDFSQMMSLEPARDKMEEKHLLVIGRGSERRALLVDEVLDEQDVVARTFDSRLGKLRDMQGVSLLRDGGVALIVDLGDLLQSMQDSHGSGSSMGMGSHLGFGNEVETSIDQIESDTETGHILVVEDSATVREVERHMLEQAGYSVTTAVNGVDGFNKLRADNFDLIISDIDMPRMNGIEMITKIRATDKYGQIPIIVVSYKDREQDRMQAMDAGANHYVTKAAFDSGEMMDRIRELIGVTA